MSIVSQDMGWTHADPDYVPPDIDTSKPSVARVYDAILGGKDNFAADRAVAELAFKAFPDGSVAFASVGAASSTIQIARVLPCAD